MRKLLSGLAIFIVLALAACSSGTTTTPKPSPSPSPIPTAKPPSTSSPTATAPSPSPAPKTTAIAPAVSFAGKTVQLVVPYTPGASTDVVSRLYAIYLPKFLPGRPSVIVRNMPGGDATIGSNYVYNAKPDGFTVLSCASGVPLNQLVGLGGVKYDLLKMPALLSNATGTAFYMKTGIIGKVEDITKAKGLIFGHTSGSTAWLFITAKELLGIPTDKVVMAYGGSGDARRALLSGEINISGDSTPAYLESVAPYVDKGELMLLFQTGLLDDKGNIVPDPGLPPIVSTGDLYQKIYGKAPSGPAWDAYRGVVTARNYARLLFLPPGTPDAVVRAYWNAVTAMVKDAEFMKAAEGLVGKSAKWSVGEDCDKGFKTNFKMDPKAVEWFRTTLNKYGVVVE